MTIEAHHVPEPQSDRGGATLSSSPEKVFRPPLGPLKPISRTHLAEVVWNDSIYAGSSEQHGHFWAVVQRLR